MSPEEYALISDNSVEEYMYPNWTEMLKTVQEIVDRDIWDWKDIRFILVLMALDNETEDVLDYLSENGSDKLTRRIIEEGKSFFLSDTRWQCAELIGRRCKSGGEDLLKPFLTDRDPYVRKRASNVRDLLKTQEETRQLLEIIIAQDKEEWKKHLHLYHEKAIESVSAARKKLRDSGVELTGSVEDLRTVSYKTSTQKDIIKDITRTEFEAVVTVGGGEYDVKILFTEDEYGKGVKTFEMSSVSP